MCMRGVVTAYISSSLQLSQASRGLLTPRALGSCGQRLSTRLPEGAWADEEMAPHPSSLGYQVEKLPPEVYTASIYGTSRFSACSPPLYVVKNEKREAGVVFRKDYTSTSGI